MLIILVGKCYCQLFLTLSYYNNLWSGVMGSELKISERLTELMNEKGISNKDLAETLGVTPCSVGRWKRGVKNMRLTQFVMIADYFNCSLDFLSGRSDNYIDFVPKARPQFYDHFKKLISDRGISRNRINTETKIKSSHLVDWKNGAEPQIYSLVELADYLDLSLDCLIGRDR